MVSVPKGSFIRGDPKGEADEKPGVVHTGAFLIDRTEVTKGAYALCVAAGRCNKPSKDGDPVDPQMPVVHVTQVDAQAYCAFVGKRLPTEAEWEKAARGVEGRIYPWGNELRCSYGNFGNFDGEGRCAAAGAPGRPVRVGSYPQGKSPYGALDMAGNVWEWVADRYVRNYNEKQGRDGREANLSVVRGGGCCSIFGLPRAADRLPLPATYHDVDIGFRCAR